jgi:hypothetical protein
VSVHVPVFPAVNALLWQLPPSCSPSLCCGWVGLWVNGTAVDQEVIMAEEDLLHRVKRRRSRCTTSTGGGAAAPRPPEEEPLHHVNRSLHHAHPRRSRCTTSTAARTTPTGGGAAAPRPPQPAPLPPEEELLHHVLRSPHRVHRSLHHVQPQPAPRPTAACTTPTASCTAPATQNCQRRTADQRTADQLYHGECVTHTCIINPRAGQPLMSQGSILFLHSHHSPIQPPLAVR